jgi:hypothetical protein
MFVTAVPNRGSPPAVLLRESHREDGMVMFFSNFSSVRESKPGRRDFSLIVSFSPDFHSSRSPRQLPITESTLAPRK